MGLFTLHAIALCLLFIRPSKVGFPIGILLRGISHNCSREFYRARISEQVKSTCVGNPNVKP